MMETIRVNMTPCEDIKTIHASQNDNEAREWGFELHNNGEKIDSSSISDQMVFKAYEGGTEEILPTNGSTPTTSPFKGDIKYPQGLLSDQEFLYRQSPAEEDGNAKITDIKGNTIVWNQLVGTNVNGLSTIQGTTFSLNSNGSIHVTGTGTGNHFCEWRTYENPSFVMVKGHKYLAAFKGLTNGIIAQVSVYTTASTYLLNKINLVGSYAEIVTPTQDGITSSLIRFYTTNTFSGTTDITMQLFDITQMGLDSLTAEQFTSLFPLPYYDYNQGSLLSFNGNGIKTVGFNQWDEEWEAGVLNSDGSISSASNRIVTSYVPILPNTTYSVTIPFNGRGRGAFYDANKQLIEYFSDFPVSGRSDVFPRDGLIESVGNNYCFLFVPPTGSAFVRYNAISSYGATYKNDICVNISNTEVNGTYEPYTSSTLSLPISTYFPNGMKSAGNVYDELTESKAITRVGSVDLGSLNWTYQSSSGNMYVDNVVSNRKNNLGFNAICSKYQQVNEDTISGVASLIQDKSFAFQYSFNGRIIVRDTSYTDATVFKQAMADQNVKLYYELATPTETSFTTASLVTENAEIPLSNEDGTLIGKCTEQLSENPGFIDAKIKLTDSDGECYSNKIQLHIERSPQ